MGLGSFGVICLRSEGREREVGCASGGRMYML